MKIKVCGLSKAEDVNFCVDNEVNYCGFILNYQKSHRFVEYEDLKFLTKINKKKTMFVGVLVRPTEDELKKFSQLDFDFFQIYGDYDSNKLRKIKEKYHKKIISVVEVKKRDDIDKYKDLEKGSDIILWDSSGYEKSLSWDFNWIRNISTNIEKMIAGNITIDKIDELFNLAEIIDVSGALETNKVKDINKIEIFFSKLKKLNNEN